MGPIIITRILTGKEEGRKERAREMAATKTQPDVVGFDNWAMSQVKQATSLEAGEARKQIFF